MSLADELLSRYAGELRGFGASLPDEFATAVRALEPRLSPEDLDRWAATGVALAHHSLRSWEAAAEYFRASPALVDRITFEELTGWAQEATELATASALMAAAYLRATPEVIDQIPPADLSPWARLGERLNRGNWKSIALSALFYTQSPRLLESLTLQSLDRFVDVVDTLTERSYELATAVLESAGDIFARLDPGDRGPFLAFARAVTRASWADTRLYFERGPRLLEHIDSEQRSSFLELAARVTTEVGRQGYPLFAESAEALGRIDPADHADLIAFANRLATGSSTAAMEFLRSAPFVRTRLTPEQMERWTEEGADVLFVERNAEGAEAYFRLESTRAEERLAQLSARVELSSVGSTLRLYAKALTGEQISIHSTEDLVDHGIGWVTESVATTEGTSIYLPPFVNAFEEQPENFQAYKVFTTHQTGRLEFGSFRYQFGQPGMHTPETVVGREAQARGGEGENGHKAPITPMQRFFDVFEDRTLIASLFTVVEDTRVDAVVSREYGGIRRSLRALQGAEAVNAARVAADGPAPGVRREPAARVPRPHGHDPLADATARTAWLGTGCAEGGRAGGGDCAGLGRGRRRPLRPRGAHPEHAGLTHRRRVDSGRRRLDLGQPDDARRRWRGRQPAADAVLQRGARVPGSRPARVPGRLQAGARATADEAQAPAAGPAGGRRHRPAHTGAAEGAARELGRDHGQRDGGRRPRVEHRHVPLQPREGGAARRRATRSRSRATTPAATRSRNPRRASSRSR